MFDLLLSSLLVEPSLQVRLEAARDAALACDSAVAIAIVAPEGRASVSNGKALHASSPLRIASITKSMTAAAALRLVEEGQLDLDAPVSTLLDDALAAILVADGYDVDAITTRQLLSHSAGLYSHAEDPRYAPRVFADPDHRWTIREQVALMAEYGDPVGAPGEKFEYSDTGYVLVGSIIETLTDKPLARAVRDLLGMDAMGLRESWWDVYEAPLATRANQYVGGEDVTHVDGSADAFGGGGLVMSMRDLATLFHAVAEGAVFEQPATLKTMHWQGAHENAARYRLGLFASPSGEGKTTWSHSGFWGTLAMHDPEQEVTLAGATNEQSDFRCLMQAMRAAALPR